MPQVEGEEDEMEKIAFARIGAVFYVVWGLLHCYATYNVYQVGLGVPHGMAQGRLFQDAFYIFALATTGIALAITMNWYNSRAGFWLNALIIGMTDVPFILFLLVPGYAPVWPGIWGPALWVAGLVFTSLGQTRPVASVQASS
jgi:hypothetical protein